MPLKVYVVYRNSASEIDEVRELLTAHEMKEVTEPCSADFVLAIGDDRSVLDAVQLVGEKDVPILGASVGSSGYLTSVSLEDLGAALSVVERGEYEVATYTKLKGVIDGSTSLYALNEIAVFPSRSAALMRYELSIDGERIWSDRADGVLVSTPLGSTAYALSAGGVIVFENAPILEVVPVNSVDASKRPLVIPDTSKVELSGISSRYPCEAIADGGTRVKVKDRVEIYKSEIPVKIMKVYSRPSVRETLRDIVEEASDMPPSAKFVLKMLEIKGSMSVRELVEATRLPERTVRYAISELVKRGFVRKVVNLRDARQFYYEAIA
ncbi:MAG: NAD(+)/NADH kinase [Thermofilaceae archaeon]|nr:NAD(+)/NADH kinase [Thermofilaceae archaeon]